jgi:hypothetical protein
MRCYRVSFPLDRLMTFVYDTMMKGSGTTYVLEQFRKKGRKDGVVIKRLRLIQATILARLHGAREARHFALADRGEKYVQPLGAKSPMKIQGVKEDLGGMEESD